MSAPERLSAAELARQHAERAAALLVVYKQEVRREGTRLVPPSPETTARAQAHALVALAFAAAAAAGGEG